MSLSFVRELRPKPFSGTTSSESGVGPCLPTMLRLALTQTNNARPNSTLSVWRRLNGKIGLVKFSKTSTNSSPDLHRYFFPFSYLFLCLFYDYYWRGFIVARLNFCTSQCNVQGVFALANLERRRGRLKAGMMPKHRTPVDATIRLRTIDRWHANSSTHDPLAAAAVYEEAIAKHPEQRSFIAVRYAHFQSRARAEILVSDLTKLLQDTTPPSRLA